MRQTIEICHIFHKGMGGVGNGCNCPVNKLQLSPYYHDVLDQRIRNYEVEHYRVMHRKDLEKYPLKYRHKIAFGRVFGYDKRIRAAIRHKERRQRGETRCTKLRRSG